MHNRRQRSRDHGAVAVEMALVTPLLVALVFGIIDFSRIFNAEIQLSQAAREGARIAALGAPYTTTNATDRAKLAVQNPAFGGSSTVGATATVCPAAPPPSADGIVTVTYTFKGILFPTTILTQTARMKCVAGN